LTGGAFSVRLIALLGGALGESMIMLGYLEVNLIATRESRLAIIRRLFTPYQFKSA